MSTQLKPTKRFHLNRFSGGTERGVCIQVTEPWKLGVANHVTMDKTEAVELAMALLEFAADTREHDYS